MLHLSEGGVETLLSTLSPAYSPCLALLQQLQAELRKLYDEETKHWTSATSVSGNGESLSHTSFNIFYLEGEGGGVVSFWCVNLPTHLQWCICI